MNKLLLPLYHKPKKGRSRKGGPEGISLTGGPGATLLTRDNFDAHIDQIGERGLPRFHLFDTEAEAHAANLLMSHEESRYRGATSETEVGRLRDGEGVLMILHRDRPVVDDQFELINNRGARERDIHGSWELSGRACAELMGTPAGLNRQDLARSIAGKLSALPAELIRDVQIGLERVPGAYTGFVAVSPEEVRGDHRLEGADPERLTDALIQPFLDRASAKSRLGDAHSEAIDATVERLLSAYPDLAPDQTDAPAL